MFEVLIDPILPVFTIAALGFFLGRIGWISTDEARLVNRFAMSVLLPILVFGLIARAPLASFRATPLMVYAGAELLIFAVGYLLARYLGRDRLESILLATSGVFANNAFYVLPISGFLYTPDSILPITAIITLDSTITFALIMIVLQVNAMGRASPAKTAATLARSPLLVAIAMGLVFNLAGVPLPDPVLTFVDFNGNAAAPVALFALGVVLSATSLRPDATVAVFASIKLFVFPAAVWLGLMLFAPDTPDAAMFVLGAAGPSSTAIFGFALMFNARIEAIAQVMVLTCILSLLTLAVLA